MRKSFWVSAGLGLLGFSIQSVNAMERIVGRLHQVESVASESQKVLFKITWGAADLLNSQVQNTDSHLWCRPAHEADKFANCFFAVESQNLILASEVRRLVMEKEDASFRELGWLSVGILEPRDEDQVGVRSPEEYWQREIRMRGTASQAFNKALGLPENSEHLSEFVECRKRVFRPNGHSGPKLFRVSELSCKMWSLGGRLMAPESVQK